MIHYALRCAAGHEFDGWFRGAAAFEQQSTGGLLACPTCASTAVSRGVMAPRVATGARPPQLPRPSPASGQDAPVQAARQVSEPLPDQVRAALQRIRAEVERTCEDVGSGFAQAARAMHDGTQTTRPIYGETTPDEARSLAEDGIEVSRIPWVPRADG